MTKRESSGSGLSTHLDIMAVHREVPGTQSTCYESAMVAASERPLRQHGNMMTVLQNSPMPSLSDQSSLFDDGGVISLVRQEISHKEASRLLNSRRRCERLQRGTLPMKPTLKPPHLELHLFHTCPICFISARHDRLGPTANIQDHASR